jgi:prephenate dehydrogenase
MPSPFQRVAILGTGLIGGSFALALRKHFPEVHITGFDREPVLREAFDRGVINLGAPDAEHAIAQADLVYIALPISTTMDLLPEIASKAPGHALVTDAGSTKRKICRLAEEDFNFGAMFLGGHPMAGKETHGLSEASAEIFSGAKYVLISEDPAGPPTDPRVAAFLSLVRTIGAEPVWLDAETHDWATAIVSHLPQLASIALADVIAEEEDDELRLPASLAANGVRDSLRLAGSSYDMWRDIAISNLDNLSRALDRLAQTIEHLRANLNSRELEKAFKTANRLYNVLRPE